MGLKKESITDIQIKFLPSYHILSDGEKSMCSRRPYRTVATTKALSDCQRRARRKKRAWSFLHAPAHEHEHDAQSVLIRQPQPPDHPHWQHEDEEIGDEVHGTKGQTCLGPIDAVAGTGFPG